jgi:hypothetical protein
MSWFGPRASGARRALGSRAGKAVGLATLVTVLVAVTGLVTGGFAKSPSFFAAAKKRNFVSVCVQRHGGNQSKGDLNVLLRRQCAKGQSPLKLALFPVKRKRGRPGPQGPQGPQGTQGPQGPQGPQGVAGKPAQTVVSSLTAPWATLPTLVSLTPDGVAFGPYANGGVDGGSLVYHGLDGMPLSAVRSISYYARYVSDGDTGGVGVPYLRIFTTGGPLPVNDAIFSPNTQPPDPDTAEGPFHEWVGTSGLWRYNDDAGAGGEFGVNGAPFSSVLATHGNEIITGIRITTGFSAGTNLAALLRWLEINGTTFAFRN